MEIQRPQVNLKIIWEVKLRINETEILVRQYISKGIINVYSIE